ncbi:peroxidase 5-like [Carex rostrata]
MEFVRVAIAFVLGLMITMGRLEAQLQVGFYSSTCPQAEKIVREEVSKAVFTNLALAAGLVRLHFHDCFVRGCEGSVLLDSTLGNTAEKDSPLNNPSLRGFEVIDSAKTRLESTCPGVVSCADIVAYAARDSVALTGGLWYRVEAGRRDGTISLASDTFSNLPGPAFDLDQLTQSFASKGLSQEEMVTLSGAHTIGRSHCTSFSSRLYSFNTTLDLDPTLNSAYATQLEQMCPNSSNDTTLVVPMDPSTPNLFDANYYADILANRGLFTSDQTLMSNASTAQLVRQNAFNGLLWKIKFAAAMVKMGQIGVLTGSSGEIRLNCSVVN